MSSVGDPIMRTIAGGRKPWQQHRWEQVHLCQLVCNIQKLSIVQRMSSSSTQLKAACEEYIIQHLIIVSNW